MSRLVARVLCIGGLDATGRAGLLADAWAVRELGAEPLAVATALTAQGGRRFWLNPVAARVVVRQLEAAIASGPVHAVKVGMIADRLQLRAVMSRVSKLDVPVVVDPVVATSRGERLSGLAARDYVTLAHPRVVLTPNAAELEWLGKSAQQLVGLGFGAVLVKGGNSAADVLTGPGRKARTFRSTPVARDPAAHRGTGCRLASALAAGLAQGRNLERATLLARGKVLEFLSRPIMPALPGR